MEFQLSQLIALSINLDELSLNLFKEGIHKIRAQVRGSGIYREAYINCFNSYKGG